MRDTLTFIITITESSNHQTPQKVGAYGGNRLAACDLSPMNYEFWSERHRIDVSSDYTSCDW